MSEIPVNTSAKALLEEQGYSFYEKALGDYNILPPRDPASGRVLDETGRYSVPMIVGDEVFHVPHSPCASGQVCNGANRDQSNPAVQAWDRALAAEKFDDVSNVAMTLATAHPVGQGAKIISGVATASSVTSAAYDGALAQTLLNEGSSRAFERVLVDVFGGRFGAGANNAFSLFGLN